MGYFREGAYNCYLYFSQGAVLRFGRIDYLNLLPFHLFLKRRLSSSQMQMMLRHGANVPSAVNRAYRSRKVDAAFISSIRARRQRHLPLGIVADGPVQSVLLLPGNTAGKDRASETSNVLADLLGLQGQVIIGDPALRAFHAGVDAVDLAEAWRERYGLPFVFAVLCYQADEARLKKLGRAFARTPQKIPYYLLARAAARSGLTPSQIQNYLTHIHYRIDHRALRALRLFWRLADVRR